ncbi:MAG: methyltransferase domain-containing protein [Anaerovoracaceae bacterium]|jgi:23S rRNA (guanine745-N1)-methyltransferase
MSISIKSIKKKDRACELIQKNKMIFKCPVCSSIMFINHSGSLTCNSNHSFDLSRKGYINLLTSSYTPVYTKELFESRHKVCEAGFYDPLIDKLAEIIDGYKQSKEHKGMNILDAGCGEGSHINSIFNKIANNSNTFKGSKFESSTFVGIDISKDSINIGARNNADIIWCVADLAKLPFQNGSFDVVLNILSPANYSEFNRVLDDEGIVIKVVPGSEYLIELRELFYKGEDGSEYSNNIVIDYFKEKLDVKDIKHINYKYELDRQLLPDFVKMTPLTWGKVIDGLNKYETDISTATVDLTILVGTKKKL